MNNPVSLRDTTAADIDVFFRQQLDPDSCSMAAFTSKDPTDELGFQVHWEKLLSDQSVIKQTVMSGDEIAGHVASFVQEGDREVTYWIGKEFWGQGIATQALIQMLQVVRTRPLLARAAKDNFASIRVLEKCGFVQVREDKGFANARGCEIEEVLFELR